jgi:hypothetical protein
VGLLFALASAIAGCASAVVPPAPAPAERERTITVIGIGEVSTEPDVVRTNLGVEATAPTVSEAMQHVTTRMKSVIAAVKGLGVADRDIQTSSISIRPERVVPGPMAAPGGKPEPKIIAHASNMVAITIRDVARAGAILDAAIAAGANEVWGLSFSRSDADGLRAKAREKAVADARARAEALASAGGVALGPLMSISEAVGGGMGRAMGMGAMAPPNEVMPIERGELTFSAQIEAVYAIRAAP